MKLNIKLFLIIVLFCFSFLIISGCKEKECETAAECINQRGACFIATCVDFKCSHKAIDECCGNYKCEEGQNYCNCKNDCGKETCEGKILLESITRGTRVEETYSEYLEKVCARTECVIDIDTSKQIIVPLIFDRDVSNYKLSIAVNTKKPFVVNQDQLEFEISLRDARNELLPFKINEIQIVGRGNRLLGRNSNFDGTLNSVGSNLKIRVPITLTPEKLETKETISMKIFYEYEQIIDTKTGDKTIRRGDFTRDFSEQIILVDVKSANEKFK
jgi:hypothetical protein